MNKKLIFGLILITGVHGFVLSSQEINKKRTSSQACDDLPPTKRTRTHLNGAEQPNVTDSRNTILSSILSDIFYLDVKHQEPIDSRTISLLGLLADVSYLEDKNQKLIYFRNSTKS